MRRVFYLPLFIMALFFILSCEQKQEKLYSSAQYIDSIMPEDSVVIFSRGMISRYMAERDAAFSPDGKEFFYSIWLPDRKGVIMHCELKNGFWTNPEPAYFSGKYSDIEPVFSPDGKRLFFASNRLVNDSVDQGYDIWYMEKINNLWSTPINAGFPVNTSANEFYPSVAANNNLYLTRGYGAQEKIIYCPFNDSLWDEAVILSDSVNESAFQFNAYIQPNEQFIIYSSVGRKDGFGGGDLYINYRDSIGNWSGAINLGEKINTTFLDYCPYITPDGKYFIFTSGKINDTISKGHLDSFKKIEACLHANENGHSDLYWVNTDLIFKETKSELKKQ
ncbi:MAG: PD40 domain-containing protein [Bacteroidales bacterium]|nr:PD40 domain-containing protein [Bacteroidales bacterium]